METDRLQVITDIHGDIELFNRLTLNTDETYLVNGDAIDGGRYSRQVLDRCLGVSAQLIVGNHEWVLLGALTDVNNDRRESWQQLYTRSRGMRYGNGLLESYGVDTRLSTHESLHDLRGKMEDLGHVALLREASVYIETNDHIFIHAGLTNESWEQQKERLNQYKENLQKGIFDTEPRQIFSHELSSDPSRFKVTDKTVVTGHSHLSLGLSQRVTADGKRVRLASRKGGDYAYTYDTETKEVTKFVI